MESNKELKNCPNCNERISVHDVQCPYCKYIDDKRYKKENDKLKKKKKDSTSCPLRYVRGSFQ